MRHLVTLNLVLCLFISNSYAAYADTKIEIADVTVARSRALPVYVTGELKCLMQN